MKERTKFVVEIVVAQLIFFVVFFLGIYSFNRNTQISQVGGKDETTAVEISQNEKLEVKMLFIERTYRMHGVYAYWDDNKEEKQKLKEGVFTAETEIKVPNKIGMHKLTIEVGLFKIKYNYYYEVVGKSD